MIPVLRILNGRRYSSVGQSIRFIPEESQVQILLPPPKWPAGQGVKTSPFHGEDTGSIPVRVTRWDLSSAGRAPASHAGGRRFKPGRSHQSRGFPVDNGQMPLLRWQGAGSTSPRRMPLSCGINSVVECHLAKVKVASSNLVSRSRPRPADHKPVFL